jgi:hypothetical protein
MQSIERTDDTAKNEAALEPAVLLLLKPVAHTERMAPYQAGLRSSIFENLCRSPRPLHFKKVVAMLGE